MKILYHLATLKPKYHQAEAIWQEINLLQAYFNGKIVWVNPNQSFRFYVPRLLFGFHQLRQARVQETQHTLHHFYNPDPFAFPYLRVLRRPVVYSITCGVGQRPPRRSFFSNLAALVVTDQRSFKQLQAWGFDNVTLVQPGIDTTRFQHTFCPLQTEIRLLVGSAPWTKAQFVSKGVEALLQAAQQMPNLQLIFLWRGVLASEMNRRVAQMRVSNQVRVLDKLVDVNQILGNVHASITLASAPGIIKAYPHSLLDSLAAGKPVLVSQAIPMADYVAQTGCGEVVEAITSAAILTAIERLSQNYESRQKTALVVGQRDFSQQAMVNAYHALYQGILERHPNGC